MKKLSVIAAILLGTTVASAQTTTTQEDIKAYVNSQITDAVTQLNGKLAEHTTTDNTLKTQVAMLESQVAELSLIIEANNLSEIIPLFAYDSYELTAEEKAKLAPVVEFMKKNASSTITIEGHTDERGSREYNLALGERRANAVKDFLISNGIAVTRSQTVSYGKERPMCISAGDPCWSINRRVQLYLNY